MNKLSIEELKLMRQRAIGDNWSKEYISVFDELIALRELKGDHVPVGKVIGRDKHLDENIISWAEDGSELPINTELFTAPQKPVVLPGISELIDACDSTPAVRDVHVWDLAISEVKRLNPSLFSERSAAGGIVKDGE